MAARLRFLLPLVLVAYFSCMMVDEASASWWSLGISSCASQSSQTCDNCATLQDKNYLSASQGQLCIEERSPTQAIARGIRRAIIECQKRFENHKWNCSTFVGDNLFGSFVAENRTRETAVLYAFLTAGAVQAVAEACQEQRIQDCPCTRRYRESPNTEGNIIFSDCDENIEWARDYVNTFVLPESSSELGEVTDKRNIEVGGGVIADPDPTESCTCHGLSGSCSVQTCYSKAVEINEVGPQLLVKYEGAVKVGLQDGELVRADNNPDADPLNGSELTFVDNSPDFCKPSPAKGILGTVGRECDPNPNSGTQACATLCCGRGFYTQTISVPITECEFVYCCEIVCRQTGVNTITKYRCNSVS